MAGSYVRTENNKYDTSIEEINRLEINKVIEITFRGEKRFLGPYKEVKKLLRGSGRDAHHITAKSAFYKGGKLHKNFEGYGITADTMIALEVTKEEHKLLTAAQSTSDYGANLSEEHQIRNEVLKGMFENCGDIETIIEYDNAYFKHRGIGPDTKTHVGRRSKVAKSKLKI